MKIEPTLGNPTEDGIYAARQWYGWRILEWWQGAWWHSGRQSRWTASAEIEAHFGPLPVISKDYTRNELTCTPHVAWKEAAPKPMEFDL